MDNQELIERIQPWQGAGIVHPMTCGIDTCRAILQPEEREGEVVLVCPEESCSYVQYFIPEIIKEYDHVRFQKILDQLSKGKDKLS